MNTDHSMYRDAGKETRLNQFDVPEIKSICSVPNWLSPLVLMNSYGGLLFLLVFLWRTNLLFVKLLLSSSFIFFLIWKTEFTGKLSYSPSFLLFSPFASFSSSLSFSFSFWPFEGFLTSYEYQVWSLSFYFFPGGAWGSLVFWVFWCCCIKNEDLEQRLSLPKIVISYWSC